jgi:hypothetical protein
MPGQNSFIGKVWNYIKAKKFLILAVVIVVIIIFALLIVLGQSNSASPFVYNRI